MFASISPWKRLSKKLIIGGAINIVNGYNNNREYRYHIF